MGERRGVFRVSVGKRKEKKPLVRPQHRQDDNIKMDLQEVGCWGVDWIDLAQDRDRWWAIVNVVMNLITDQNNYYFLIGLVSVGFALFSNIGIEVV